MAEVPPTPLLPLRMGHGVGQEWDDESLLMDQQPNFGDDPIFDITFNIEQSQDGIEVGEMDTPKRGEGSRSMLEGMSGRLGRALVQRADDWSEATLELESELNVMDTGGDINGQGIATPTLSAKALYEDDDLECEVGRNAGSPALDDQHDFAPIDTGIIDDFDYDIAPLVPDESSYINTLAQQPEELPPSPIPSSVHHTEDILEDTSFLGWGERPTLAESERSLSPNVSIHESRLASSSSTSHSSASATSHKRAATSPRQAAEKKKIKPRSPGQDDYFRRLSRQSSSGSLGTPSLPSLYLSNSTSSISRSISGSREVSEGGPSRTSGLNASRRRDVPEEESQAVAVFTDDEDAPPPAPRATMLSRFLAKSTVLHPAPSASPKQAPPTASAQSRTSAPTTSLSSSTQSASTPRLPMYGDTRTETITPTEPEAIDLRRSTSRGVSTQNRLPTPNLCDTSISSAASTSSILDLGASLRRSTSQRVIGFFSDLLGTSTPAKAVEPAASSPAVPSSSSGDKSAPAITQEEQDGDGEADRLGQAGQDTSQTRYESRPSSSSSRYAEIHRPPSLAPIHARNRDPPGYRPLTRPNHAFVSHTASRAGNPIRQSKPVPVAKAPKTSSFASAALARLPPPGKGASSAGEKVTVKPMERASNLQARRALFERPQNQAQAQYPAHVKGQPHHPSSKAVPVPAMKKTIPVTGRTPGKAARARAEERRIFDRAVQERLDEKQRLKEAEERKRKEEEERDYAARRKETVVRANPVPGMYRRKGA